MQWVLSQLPMKAESVTPLLALARTGIAFWATRCISGCGLIERESELIRERSRPRQDITQLMQLLLSRALPNGAGEFS